MFENKLQSFSLNGSLLAICASNGVLKLWDTSSGILEHEFQPAEHLSSSATCLAFSPKPESPEEIVKKKKKKRNSKYEKETCKQLLAMGTVEGTILVYSPSQQEIVAKLCHSTSVPVTDLCWQSETELISLGQDKNLTMWDIISKKKIRNFGVGGCSSVCIIGKNRFGIASNNIHLLSYNQETDEEQIKSLSGHKTPIIQITPVILNKESQARYLLSAAENDKFIYAWSTSSDIIEPVASFMAKDIVRTFSCVDTSGSSVGIAVTTKKGLLRYFSHHLNGSKGGKPIPSQGQLRINSATTKDKLSIIGSHFLSATSLIVVYGTELFPWCEILDVETLQDKVTWVRKDPSSFCKTVESALIKTVTPHIPDDAVYLMPTHMNPTHLKEVNLKRKKGGSEAVLPMEERLDFLSLTKPLLGATPRGRPLDNYVHLLIQALQSKDSTLLNNILSKGEDEEVINNTVRRLPITHIVTFLKCLQEVIVGKGPKNVFCINWIRSILHHHMSFLSTLPEKDALMQPFHAVCAARVATLDSVTKLHSRINMLLTHVKNRHENADQKSSNSQAEALLVYRDESSDDEDNLRMDAGGAPSESEDIWDDWTEEDDEGVKSELNCHSDEDELKGISGRESEEKAIKRKMGDNILYDKSDDYEMCDEEILENNDIDILESDDE